MAVLTPDQYTLQYQDSQTDTYCLIAIRRCNTGDTINVSEWFKSAKLATVLWTTTAKSDKLSAPIANVITLDTAGLSDDAGWLSVWGSRA